MTVSLGVIETLGLTSAIHAADAACKAAGVSLTGYRKAGSGLVSVYFEGEISAVKAAIDCGLDVISSQDFEAMSLVLARPDSSVLEMLASGPICSEPESESLPQAMKQPEQELISQAVAAKPLVKSEAKEEEVSESKAIELQATELKNAEGSITKAPTDKAQADESFDTPMVKVTSAKPAVSKVSKRKRGNTSRQQETMK